MKKALATACTAALIAASSLAFAADNSGGNNGDNGGVDANTTNSTNQGLDTGTQDNKAADPNCDTAQAPEGCNNMQQ